MTTLLFRKDANASYISVGNKSTILLHTLPSTYNIVYKNSFYFAPLSGLRVDSVPYPEMTKKLIRRSYNRSHAKHPNLIENESLEGLKSRTGYEGDHEEEAGEQERNANDNGITPYLAAIALYPGANSDVNELIAPLHKATSFSPSPFIPALWREFCIASYDRCIFGSRNKLPHHRGRGTPKAKSLKCTKWLLSSVALDLIETRCISGASNLCHSRHNNMHVVAGTA